MKKHALAVLATFVAGAFSAAHADTLKMECASFTGMGKPYCDYIKQLV